MWARFSALVLAAMAPGCVCDACLGLFMQARRKPTGRLAAGHRLLCTDLDGTLFNSEHSVPNANANALANAHRRGFTVVLCSGRGPTMYMPTARELGIPEHIYLVGYNGAIVCRLSEDGGIQQTFFEVKMSRAQVDKVLRLAEGLSVELDIGATQLARCEGDEQRRLLDDHAALVRSSPKILPTLDGCDAPNKMTVLTREPAAFVARAASIPDFEADGIGVVVGGPFWVETVALRSDKAVGVRLLCQELGASLEDCIYFGDGANDATSLAAVGLGIAMANAKPEAKRASRRVSAFTNDDAAVAKEVNNILDSA